MDPMTKKEGFELEINIEELEAKIAPDSGSLDTGNPNG